MELGKQREKNGVSRNEGKTRSNFMAADDNWFGEMFGLRNRSMEIWHLLKVNMCCPKFIFEWVRLYIKLVQLHRIVKKALKLMSNVKIKIVVSVV